MASSSSCSLSQPLIGSGKDVTHVIRYTEGNTRPVVAWVASASHLRAEAAELCNQASVRTNQTSKTLLVSEFWNQESRDRLSTNASLSEASSFLAKSSSCPVVVSKFSLPEVLPRCCRTHTRTVSILSQVLHKHTSSPDTEREREREWAGPRCQFF